MREEVSRSDLHTTDYSLPRSKILRGRRNFERLFEKSTVLNTDSLQFRYRIYQDPTEGCLVGFIAPKKRIKKAVKRNKIKRLMRESYRLNQHILQDLFSQHNIGFHGAFLAGSDQLTFESTSSQVIELLQKTKERLMKYSSDKKSGGRLPDNHKV
ncbi:MAG: ribonuclease P protein component [Balneolaceae bacterium]|nr:MAG: ribonuclease P protein component [Balneolaceae bacterium]